MLNLKLLAAVALGATIVSAGAAYQVQEWRYTAQIEALHSKYQKASQAAVSQALEEQQRQMAAAETEGAKGEAVIEQISADIAGDTTNDSLRDDLDKLRRSTTRKIANAATQRLADQQTIGVLTHMLEECSGFAGVVAGAFEDARARGLTCQAVYNEIRSNAE